MQICIISTYLPSNGSGLGLTEYTYQLENHIKPLLSKKDSIENLYAISESKRNNIAGLIYTNTGFKNKLKKIKKNEYDIIHITDPEIGFAAKILKKMKNKAKIITTIHDLTRFEKNLHKGFTQKIYNKLVQGSISDAIKYSDFIICNSSQTKDTVKYRFKKRNKIKTILLGIDDSIINNKKNKLRNKKEFVIGYIGALMKHKNVMFILKAAEELKNNNYYKFKIYGTGVDKQFLDNYKNIKKLNNVIFNGYVLEIDKSKIYDSFDTFVFPSLYEGFGLPIIEAQARGLPVIIYKYGRIPKEVRKYCFEAESHEHMAKIIENLKENGYNEKQRKMATEYARSFTWKKCAKETLEVYKKIHNKNK